MSTQWRTPPTPHSLHRTMTPLRARHGFTLIEIVAVVTIIGLLAMIAIPKFTDTKSRAYVAAMKSDLKNLNGSAEAWYFENKTYIGFPVPTGSPGVALTMTASATGWTAHATHGATSVVCDIQAGNLVVLPNNDGEPFCQ
jgi:prepilin-type N-terminal cleavage/methylation domain-containing protein